MVTRFLEEQPLVISQGLVIPISLLQAEACMGTTMCT